MKSTKWPAALLCGLALAMPLAAQEEPAPNEPPPPPTTETKPAAETAPSAKNTEPKLHRWGAWTVSIAAWEPTLLSADEEIVVTNDAGTAVPLMAGSTSSIKETVEVTYHLPRDAGSIVGHYSSMNHDDLFEHFTPGQFDFLESRGFPFALGAFDDGFADGVRASLVRKTREFRLEFAKKVFDSKWARGIFKAGYRQVNHDRDVVITSYAIVPNLPPVIPPSVPDTDDPLRLAPIPDVVHQRSNYFGHGIGAALDVEFPLHPRFSIIAGLSIGLIRGASDSEYTSQSSYYFKNGSEDVPLTKEELFAILESGTEDQIQAVGQAVVLVGLRQPSTPQVAVSYDVYVGVEGTLYRGLKMFARLRDVYYANVGEYVVPRTNASTERTTLNAGYEGYCVGLSWRF